MTNSPKKPIFKKKSDGVVFFDYTSKTKTRIIKDASIGAAKKKQALLNEYGPIYKKALAKHAAR